MARVEEAVWRLDPAVGGGIPDDDELIARAQRLIPILRERQEECEALGRVPDETIADFRAAGLLKVLQPREYGGYGRTPLSLMRVLREVARGCPSSGWVLMVLGIHQYEVPIFGEQAARDIWGEDNTQIISSSYVPFGTVQHADGGFVLNGRWNFSSGCDHCQWALLGGLLPAKGGDGAPEPAVFLVPRSNYAIDSNSWSVFGLQGTGSKSLLLDQVFVPHHRVHSQRDAFEMKHFARVEPAYRFPFGTMLSLSLVSAIIGMAQGARDMLLQQIEGRKGAWSGVKTTENPGVRLRLARVDSIIGSAIAMVEFRMMEMQEHLDRDEPVPVALRTQTIFDAAQIGNQCLDVVLSLYKMSGGSGTSRRSPIQRYLRDILAATNHIVMNADEIGVNAGAVTLGHANANMFI